MDTSFVNDKPKAKQALQLCKLHHRGQWRKWSNVPYWHHPVEVTEILLQCDYVDDDTIAASLLHDTREDTDITVREIEAISSKTFRLVEALTNTNRWDGDKDRQLEHNLKRLSFAPRDAKLIKAADVLHNSRDIVQTNIKRAPKYLIKKIRTLEAVQTDSNVWKQTQNEMGGLVKQAHAWFEEDQRLDRKQFEDALVFIEAEELLQQALF